MHGTLPGGKGGFGNQLKRLARRMNRHTYQSEDSGRDLSGRRIRETHAADEIVAQVGDDAVRARRQQEQRDLDERRRRVEAEIERLESSTSKRKIDDSALRESERAQDITRDALQAGFAKRRKRAKLADKSCDSTDGCAAQTTSSRQPTETEPKRDSSRKEKGDTGLCEAGHSEESCSEENYSEEGHSDKGQSATEQSVTKLSDTGGNGVKRISTEKNGI